MSAALSEVVMVEGRFDSFSLEEVFMMLGISRQRLRVEFRRGTRPTGAFWVQSGRVLAVKAPPEAEPKRAFFHLCRASGDEFAIFRSTQEAVSGTPVGHLDEWVAELFEEDSDVETVEPTRPQPMVPTVLAAGRMDLFSLEEIFEVASLTRQRVQLRLRDAKGVAGSVTIKAGKVIDVDAQCAGLEGLPALREILRSDDLRSFELLLLQQQTNYPEALAEVIDLAEIKRRTSRHVPPPPPARALPDVAPRPEPVVSGSFRDHAFEDVLDVVGLSRQLLEVRLRKGADRLGSFRVKAGQLVEVRPSGGFEAFRRLRDAHPTGFEVVRLADVPSTQPPIGSLQDVAVFGGGDVARAPVPDARTSARPDARTSARPEPPPSSPAPARNGRAAPEALAARLVEQKAAGLAKRIDSLEAELKASTERLGAVTASPLDAQLAESVASLVAELRAQNADLEGLAVRARSAPPERGWLLGLVALQVVTAALLIWALLAG